MTFYISVVSHQHHHIIERLDSLRRLAFHDDIEVICRDNIPSVVCQEYCDLHGVHYLKNPYPLGFSANNNENYLYAKNVLGMMESDYFVLMNPDVLIDQKNIKKLVQVLEKTQVDIAAPCLFIDKAQQTFDDNLRKYPSLMAFAKNYILHDRSTVIDKRTEEPEMAEYWASAAFLCVRSEVYEELKGFDETYYMYCEDVDFCLRASKKGYQTCYLRNVHAVHFRRLHSRKFLSRPFFWHVKSAILYCLASRQLREAKSALSLKQPLNNSKRYTVTEVSDDEVADKYL